MRPPLANWFRDAPRGYPHQKNKIDARIIGAQPSARTRADPATIQIPRRARLLERHDEGTDDQKGNAAASAINPQAYCSLSLDAEFWL
jgi:hypothetical protein